MSTSLPLIFFSVACGVAGQITLKLGMIPVGQIGENALQQPLQVALRVFTSPLVLVGLGLYVLGALSWLTMLSRVPLSFAYPLVAVSYAITPLLALIFLREAVPSMRWLGILTICLGAFLVSRT